MMAGSISSSLYGVFISSAFPGETKDPFKRDNRKEGQVYRLMGGC